MPKTSFSSTAESRVTKKLNPGERGTRALLERFGDKLICVRYRTLEGGLKRLTTVELVVAERSPAPPKRTATTTVSLTTRPDEHALHEKLRAQGARWDSKARHWQLPLALAKALGITHRIR